MTNMASSRKFETLDCDVTFRVRVLQLMWLSILLSLSSIGYAAFQRLRLTLKHVPLRLAMNTRGVTPEFVAQACKPRGLMASVTALVTAQFMCR